MLFHALLLAQTITAVSAAQAPTLDGRLDEAIWQGPAAITQLRQRTPSEGTLASEATSVWVAYDRDHLYVAFRAEQRTPLRAYYLEPDFGGGDDTLSILIDPWRDRRNGYVFTVNANGVRKDQLVTDNGRYQNEAWNGVWWAEARRTEDGWTGELRIPFSTLTYPIADVQSWGFNIQRRFARRRLAAVWQGWQRRFNFADPGVAGTLEGLRSIRSGQRVQIQPYGMAGLAALDQDTSAPLTSLYNVGLDVNALVAPPVKLTLTINPDFAQVEADQAQLNLSHHSLYLPEKRLFFIEGKDFFSFATSSGNQPFYSRRIGLDEEGNPLPILGGVRLLGRSGKTNVGLLTAQMSPESWRFEETRNASVLRVKQNILKRSAIGALATASTQGASVEGVAGLDLRLRTTEFATNKTLELTAAGALGWSRAAGQQGETWRLALAWPNANWTGQLSWERISRDYDPALGFTALNGVDRLWLNAHYTHAFKDPKHRLRNIQFGPFDGYLELDDETHEWSHYRLNIIPLEGVTRGGQWAKLELVLKGYQLSDDWEIIDGYTAPAGAYNDFGVRANYYRGSQGQLGVYGYVEEASYFGGRRTSSRLWLQWKANRHLRLATGNGVYWMRADEQAALGRDHYLRVHSSINRRWHGSLLGQWNSDSQETLINLRLRYIPRPGADAYLVLNQALDQEGVSLGTSVQGKLVWRYGL